MPRLEPTLLAAHIRRMAAPESDALTDSELVGRYAGRRDAAAFEVLVWRHGPMVWATCRRILRHRHDVEDAFQATFLALARSAGTLGSRQAVGGWLHRVAVNAALKLKANRRPAALTEDVPAHPERDDREFAGAVDEEVERLPDRMRAAFVLCCLEGMTGAEAARELGCPVGTVDSRLHAARARLRDRLTRRGFGPGALAGLVIVAAPPAAVVAAAVGVGTGVPPAPAVTALATHASRIVTHGTITMKTGIGAVLALALAGTVWAFNSGGAPSVVPKPDPVSAPARGVIALPPAPVTVWGEPVDGLQAGLRCPAGKQVLPPGESVELELIVRNVSRELIGIEYLAWKNQMGGSAVLSGEPDRGELRLGWSVSIHGIPGKDSVHLGAGEEMVRGQVTLVHGKVGPVPAGTRPPIGLSAGVYRVTVDPVGEPAFDRLGWPGGVAFPRLGTGVLELTLSDATVRAAPVPTALDEEVAKLQGEWVVVAWEEEGEKAPAAELKGKKLVIKGNEITGLQPGPTDRVSFKLDPKKTPKEIDMTVVEGNLKGTTAPGIYAIEGQKLRICLAKVRPKEFATTPGSGREVLTLEKVTPTAWGEPVNGLRAGLRAPKTALGRGESVEVELVLKNEGTSAVVLDHPTWDRADGAERLDGTPDRGDLRLGWASRDPKTRAETSLPPGKVMVRGRVILSGGNTVVPATGPVVQLAPGKYRVSVPDVGGAGDRLSFGGPAKGTGGKPPAPEWIDLSDLGTGVLEVIVTDEEPVRAAPAPRDDQRGEGRIVLWRDGHPVAIDPGTKGTAALLKGYEGKRGSLRVGPDGKLLIYIANRDTIRPVDPAKQDRLYVWDGKTSTEIKDEVFQCHAFWGADGKVYGHGLAPARWADRELPPDLTKEFANWSFDPQTGKVKYLKLAGNELTGNVSILDISPDGKAFLVRQYEKPPGVPGVVADYRLGVLPAAGGDLLPLTKLGEDTAGGFRYSPDGRFALGTMYRTAGDMLVPELVVFDLKSRTRSAVTVPKDAWVGASCWSPDGKRIAFVWEPKAAYEERNNRFGPVAPGQEKPTHTVTVARPDGSDAKDVYTETEYACGSIDWRGPTAPPAAP